ncbi:MAG: hypothetical protein Q9M94_01905 [Candidatus Gracilibacteria bacterium]|nr:hypothetical protein [Candidatus Gracilibacteria bacterium]MDQ7021966.1 hypothetical protein [Candidatus Gracilibacteria bacterium]
MNLLEIKLNIFQGLIQKFGFLSKRIEKNIGAKVIVSDGEGNKDINYKEKDKNFKRETILIKKDLFKMKNEITLYSEDK